MLLKKIFIDQRLIQLVNALAGCLDLTVSSHIRSFFTKRS